MVTLSTSMLVALLITGGITSLAMLSVFANVIGHETQLHDLRNNVKDLQFKQAMYLAKINGQIPDDEPIMEVEEYIDPAQEESSASLESNTPNTSAQSLPPQEQAPATAA